MQVIRDSTGLVCTVTIGGLCAGRVTDLSLWPLFFFGVAKFGFERMLDILENPLVVMGDQGVLQSCGRFGLSCALLLCGATKSRLPQPRPPTDFQEWHTSGTCWSTVQQTCLPPVSTVWTMTHMFLQPQHYPKSYTQKSYR